MIAPFFVFGLPRSRTAWLSKFLTYGRWTCGHEELRHMRSLEDVRSWLSIPYVGTAETAAAPFWRLLVKYQPDARIVVVRRPVAEVVKSIMAIDTQDAGVFDRAALTHAMQRIDAKLDQIAARAPNVMEVWFEDLAKEETCATVFEYCLPYKHNHLHWSNLDVENVQCNFPALMRHMRAFAPQMLKLAATAHHVMLTDLAAAPAIPPDGVTFQCETFDDFLRDGQHLFAEHSVQVGEHPLSFGQKNLPLTRKMEAVGGLQIMTARCNGRMFGYLVTLIGPSFENENLKSAVHTAFFGSSDIPGIGMKLQRAALAKLRADGIGEVLFRAGPRGSGPKMGALYRRLGAEDDGQLFRLKLKDV